MSAENSREPKPSAQQASAFDKCLVDPDRATASRLRLRRTRAIGLSAFVELSVLAALLIWPLFATGTRLIRREFIPLPPYGHHSEPPAAERSSRPQPPINHGPLAHRGIAIPIHPPHSVSSGGSGEPNGPDIQGIDLGPGVSSNTPSNLLDIGGNTAGPPPPAVEAPAHHAAAAPIRRSEGVQSALLIHRVEPCYPPLAQQIHREGTVQVHAVISRDGTIESLEVLSGDPLFIRCALDAVRQWRYRPTLLGGEPVEVDTYITVNFRISHQ